MARICQRCNYSNTDDARFCLQCGAMMEQEAPEGSDPLVGQIFQNRYRIKNVIGEGGMGKVYLAEQRMGTKTRDVAVKTLHPELSGDPQLVARFYRECETVIDLSHANTIKFFDFGELDDKTLYIVMEYIEGESLAHALQRGAMPPERVDKILVQIAGSLHEAHQQGVVHRDLKPENVLLTNRAGQADFVKVLDFGIAKRSDAEDESQAKLTKQGMVLGTPPYMSPEQFSGQALDPRSDIYSLGIMTYEMLMGQLPFEAKTPWEWATKHLTAQPTPVDVLPSGMQLVENKRNAVMRALAKNRDQRHTTVMEYLQEFTGFQDPQAAWTMATSMGGSAPQATPPPQPRALVGTPAPMPTGGGGYPSGATPAPGTGPFQHQTPAPVSYNDWNSASMELPTRGGGAGKVIAIVAVLLFLVVAIGGGTAAVIIGSKDSDPEPPEAPVNNDIANNGTSNPNNTAMVDPANILMPNTNTNTNVMVPSTPDTDMVDPTMMAEPVEPTMVEPTMVEPTMVEPTMVEPGMTTPMMTTPMNTTMSGDRSRGEAAARAAESAVAANNYSQAVSQLRTAQSILGRRDPAVNRARSALARRASNQVGVFMQQGNCAGAQRLYRSLRTVGADGPSRIHFGDWCSP
ncbi:MAG: protein kinase [Myxococcota bacterium]